MPDARTTITELVTGLGTLGFDTVDDALGARPSSMVSVSPALWDDLERWWRGAYRREFEAAFANGRALLRAADGLRGRVPLVVDWRGTSKPIDDELVPADLRIDHVYLVSCKYLSKIVANAAPARLFDGLLRLRTPSERTSWFDVVAPAETAALLHAARQATGIGDDDRRPLAKALTGRAWPDSCRAGWAAVCDAVSERSAARWSAALETKDDRLRLLWKLLRIGPTPYFVLGVGDRGPLRLRVQTSWDWSYRYRLEGFEVALRPGGQPMVEWRAAVRDRDVGSILDVHGHVEVRWSHGRFNGAPEAKVYLDTSHTEVPGYLPLQ